MEHRLDITQLLQAYGDGERRTLDRLLPLVYEQLRTIAHARLRGERPGHTLNTTGLVHEAYLKLAGLERIRWRDRRHFFALAARLMRQVLIDYARVRRAAKRGGGVPDLSLEEACWMPVEQAERLIELEEALTRLSVEHPRVGEALAYHYFAGLSNEEAAQVLGVSVPTVERDLRFGRTWLAAFFAPGGAAYTGADERHG